MSLHADLSGVKIGDDYPVRIVGVINVSPESFYKGSVRVDLDEVSETARRMVEEGADIIDVGAMSTAPYLKGEIPVEEEARRLSTAIKTIQASVNVPISADTKRSMPARAALNAGADILNDVSGLKEDPGMAPLVAERKVGTIICACEKKKAGNGPVERVLGALRESLEVARKAGVLEERIVVDPAIGFIRDARIPWYDWDCEIINRLESLRALGRPIHVGVSRKSFIGKLTDRATPEERLFGSLSAAAIAVYNGAHAIRTHDVAATKDAVRMAGALRERLAHSRDGG